MNTDIVKATKTSIIDLVQLAIFTSIIPFCDVYYTSQKEIGTHFLFETLLAK